MNCKYCNEEIHLDNVGYYDVNQGKGILYHNHNDDEYCNLNDRGFGKGKKAEQEEEYETGNNFMKMLEAL